MITELPGNPPHGDRNQKLMVLPFVCLSVALPLALRHDVRYKTRQGVPVLRLFSSKRGRTPLDT